MTPEQRRQAVERMLAESPQISQSEIAKACGCSQKTISRDIAKLTAALVSSVTGLTGAVRQGVSAQVGRGDSLVARLRGEMAEQGLIPTSGEEELLAVAHDLANRIALLQGIVQADGERRKSKDGRIFMHPGLSEIRQCEATLSRVLAGIQTMETPLVDRTKQRAAQVRWRQNNRARGLTAAETPGG